MMHAPKAELHISFQKLFLLFFNEAYKSLPLSYRFPSDVFAGAPTKRANQLLFREARQP
jgi:hypothetical protein